MQLLAKLHRADLLHGETLPDMGEIERRADRHEKNSLLTWIKSPMAMRFPLFDPDRFLERTMPVVRPLFTVPGFVLWLVLIAAGAVLAAMHWQDSRKTCRTGHLRHRTSWCWRRSIRSSKRSMNSGTPMRPRPAGVRSTNSGSCCWCSCRSPMWMRPLRAPSERRGGARSSAAPGSWSSSRWRRSR